AAPALAQPGAGFGPGMLLTNKGVQKELKLTDDQVTKLDAAMKKIREKQRDIFTKLQDVPQEERRAKAQEMFKQLAEETQKATAGILKPDQEKRLKQIQLQMQGARAYADPEVQKALKLTDAQKDKIKKINEEAAKERTSSRENAGGDFQEAMKKLADLRKATSEKAAGVLTDEQKKAWKELTGEPFEVKFETRPRRER